MRTRCAVADVLCHLHEADTQHGQENGKDGVAKNFHKETPWFKSKEPLLSRGVSRVSTAGVGGLAKAGLSWYRVAHIYPSRKQSLHSKLLRFCWNLSRLPSTPIQAERLPTNIPKYLALSLRKLFNRDHCGVAHIYLSQPNDSALILMDLPRISALRPWLILPELFSLDLGLPLQLETRSPQPTLQSTLN